MSSLGELLKQVLKLPPKQDEDQNKKQRLEEYKMKEQSILTDLYNKSRFHVQSENKSNKRKRKADIARDENEEEKKDRDESTVINIMGLKKLLKYCKDQNHIDEPSSSSSNKFNVYRDLWHYLQQDLLKSRVQNRMQLIYLINCLAKEDFHFLPVLNENISIVARSAGLLQSISLETREKELAKDHSQDFVEFVKEMIEYWDHEYGSEHSNIHNLKRYFVESLGLRMPNLQDRVMKIVRTKAKEETIEENKIVITTEKVIQYEFHDMIRAIQRELLTIDECYQILFPRIESKFFAVPQSSLIKPSILDDNDKNQDTSVYEEIDDLDNVEWESEEKVVDQTGKPRDNYNGETMTSLQSSLPFTLEIRFSTAAKDLTNADNEVIVEAVREIASNIVTNHFPKLKQWKKLIEHSLTILNRRKTVAKESQAARKLKAQVMENEEDEDNTPESYLKLIVLYEEKLKELILLMDDCKLILKGKCKDLLK